MKRLIRPAMIPIALVAGLAASGSVSAGSPIELKKYVGVVGAPVDGVNPFVLAGEAPHLGRFVGYGEVQFVPGETEGSLVGLGVVLFTAADGDQLVGIVLWEMTPTADGNASMQIEFHWRDAVQFSDGSVVASTGRFEEKRPPGLFINDSQAQRILADIAMKIITIIVGK